MTDLDATKLIDQAKSGDQDAFSELYRQSLPQIKAVGSEIFRGHGSEADLEDFCSDVWILGLKYLSRFRGECRFSTWIVQIAKHKALAILQRRGQAKNGDSRLVYQGKYTSDEQCASECSAEEDRRLEAATAQSDVARLMELISPKSRELVQLYHLEGFSESEIARKTGLTVPAIRGRLSRVLVQLRKIVEKSANRNDLKISLTK